MLLRNESLKEAIHNLLHKRDGLMIGICNGFQALIKLGLLPDGEIRDMTQNDATLTFNTIGRHLYYRECLGSLPCRFQQRNYKHSAVIFGPTPLEGRDIDVPDLRGGFSHLIAALAAKGPSDVRGISLIDRGYADFRGKLTALGAQIN